MLERLHIFMDVLRLLPDKDAWIMRKMWSGLRSARGEFVFTTNIMYANKFSTKAGDRLTQNVLRRGVRVEFGGVSRKQSAFFILLCRPEISWMSL